MADFHGGFPWRISMADFHGGFQGAMAELMPQRKGKAATWATFPG